MPGPIRTASRNGSQLFLLIQVLLGHKKLDTTTHYSQVDSSTLKAVKSPLEQLAVRKKSQAS